MEGLIEDIAAVDLFCGAGGLTHGLIRAGIPVRAGFDIDPACKFPYEENNSSTFHLRDVALLNANMIDSLFGSSRIRVLAGCAPCQPFSSYSQRYETVGTDRWKLLYSFARHVRTVVPDIVTMENVPTVKQHSVFHDFVDTLKSMGYYVWSDVVDCSLYGLPQTRKRMVLLASRYGEINLLPPTHNIPVTVQAAIQSLPPLSAGESDSADPLHAASRLSPLNLARIKASKPNGTWKDWPEDLVALCHRKRSGKTYPGVYGRMSFSGPSPTLTTQFFGFGNGRFGHPEQDRGLSLREGAILQGFPPGYKFVEPGKVAQFKALGRLIGNAVPVTIAEVIGQSILEHLRRNGELPSKNEEPGSAADVASASA